MTPSGDSEAAHRFRNSVKRLEVRTRAIDDIYAATDFYAAAGELLAERWLTALRRTVSQIGRRPTFGSTAFAQHLDVPGLRHRSVPQYPYLVFSLDTDVSVVIVRVLHERRDVRGELSTDDG